MQNRGKHDLWISRKSNSEEECSRGRGSLAFSLFFSLFFTFFDDTQVLPGAGLGRWTGPILLAVTPPLLPVETVGPSPVQKSDLGNFSEAVST